MQKVQRWSQPFCTCTKARARPSKPSTRCAAVSRHRHDVVDARLFPRPRGRKAHARARPDARAKPSRQPARSFSSLPRTSATSGMSAKRLGLGLRRAARDDDAAPGRSRLSLRIAWRDWRTASAVTAQVLTTTVSVKPAAARLAADHLRLVGIEPAAEGDDVDAHAAPAFVTADAANSAGSNRPSYSYSTGPVISTWSSRSRHSIAEIAARQRHRHRAAGAAEARRRHRRRAGGRAAGLGQAGAALPGAHDDVLARHHLRKRDIGALRERSDGSPAAARSCRGRRRRRRRPRRSRADCPC